MIAVIRSFTVGQILLAVLSSVVLQTGVFSYAVVTKTDPVNYLDNQLPVLNLKASPSTAPRLAYYITGSMGGGSLKKPMAVTVFERRIYVSDTNNQRVQVFDYSGKPLFKFGEFGEGRGQFKYPYGIAALPGRRILVADLYNGSVSIFDPAGKFLGYFAESDPKENVLQGPAGIYVHEERVYVTDVKKNQVLVFDPDGRKISEIGTKGTRDGQLISPNGVAARQGRIYVTDTGNDRIQVFDESGELVRVIKNAPGNQEESLLITPRGIDFDGQGILYAVSGLTNLVHGLTPEGKPLFTFGGVGAADNQFYLPNGLFIDDQGRIYVTDTANSRVAVYQN